MVTVDISLAEELDTFYAYFEPQPAVASGLKAPAGEEHAVKQASKFLSALHFRIIIKLKHNMAAVL